ncbi:protein PAL OF QUIRKY-like [Lycium ferocissimum]|uniref:protein PAL OF QUIRKY-like n=1 Tax=Lycium ferocissimum TaxID=112874 RepID=UPI0028162857|nr:protein PAL OF QUIRKY-like [Lycium ferocissimum]
MSRNRNLVHSTEIVKFFYSYGGKILPRRSDGKLRYIGGFTRVLSIDRSISFSELIVKFGELCGSSMDLRCKLPTEELDVLVSITCDEDLANMIEEYDRVSTLTNKEMKIRAILSPINLPKKISPPSSPMSCFDFPASTLKSPPSHAVARRSYSPALGYPVGEELYYPYCGNGSVRPLYYVVPHHYYQ